MIEAIHEITRALHIGAGFVGLAAFWLPLFAKKGGRVHKTAGNVFKYCAYIVLAAAVAGLAVYFAQAAAAGVAWNDPQLAFLIFLSYLTYVTYLSLHQGLQVLSAKRDLSSLNSPWNRLLAFGAIGLSVAIVAYAVSFRPSNQILLFALSPLGILGGLGVLTTIRGQRPESKAWFYEHMGNMIGCGIAFHTAFAVFGSQAIFNLSLPGWMQVIPWIAPTLIGVPAITIWTRYYQRKFRDGPFAQTA